MKIAHLYVTFPVPFCTYQSRFPRILPSASRKSSALEPVKPLHLKEGPSDGASIGTGLEVFESDPFEGLEDEIFVIEEDFPTPHPFY